MGEFEDRERFIPLRKSEVVDLICEDGFFDDDGKAKFRGFARLLESIFHFEFQEKVEELKELYYPFNPDPVTSTFIEYSEERLKEMEAQFIEKFGELLNNANFDEVSKEEIEYAFEEDSEIAVNVETNLEDFDRLILYKRGETVHSLTVPRFFSLLKKELKLNVLERLVMLIKFSAGYEAGKSAFQTDVRADKIYLKIFKNVPKPDLEMLFPNSQVKMKLMDKLKIGVPLVLGGALTGSKLLNIFGGTLSLTVMGGAVGALIGYVIKSFISYKNTVLRYITTLSQGLYFSNLDNNAGVFHSITDEAEGEEVKEALLGYYFMLKNPEPRKAPEVDGEIEEWFENKYGIRLDFEIDDSLSKLERLELAKKLEDNLWKTIDLDKSLERLDCIWDNYFEYNV